MRLSSQIYFRNGWNSDPAMHKIEIQPILLHAQDNTKAKEMNKW